jgi:hypothetical protein
MTKNNNEMRKRVDKTIKKYQGNSRSLFGEES